MARPSPYVLILSGLVRHYDQQSSSRKASTSPDYTGNRAREEEGEKLREPLMILLAQNPLPFIDRGLKLKAKET